MVDTGHINRLLQGVDVWNAWRAREPSAEPNLDGADFTDADLAGANLYKAKLSNAILLRANLAGADLRNAHLNDTTLQDANLSKADLSEATLFQGYLWETDLAGANLTGAQLFEARLIRPDLRGAKLIRTNLEAAQLMEPNFSGVDLEEAVLTRANFVKADFTGANLTRAILASANLINANFTRANLTRADLTGANLVGANLAKAKLIRTDLRFANLVGANFADAETNLDGCRVYGMSAWDLKLEGAKQQNLIITTEGDSEITVDNIEIAQFIYLLLHNYKLRSVIDTITSKTVLILGRFTPKRKPTLDRLRNELRLRNYLPIMFDFKGPTSRNKDETITLLARMARFVIADITDAKSILQELRGIVPDLPSVAIQPIILSSQEEPGMFDFFQSFHWFLETYPYNTPKRLFADLDARVILPAETKVTKIRSATAPG